MPATGPKVSSHDIAASCETPVSTVGCQKSPPSPSPPTSTSAPRSTASATWRCTLSIAPCSISGPTCVSGSRPLPTLSAEAASTSRDTNSSWMPACARMRFAEMQVWPLLRYLQIGVVEDDEGRVASELERDLLHLRGTLRHQQLSHLGRAGEAELPDRGVPRELAADDGCVLRGSGDELEHTLRQAGLEPEPRDRE